MYNCEMCNTSFEDKAEFIAHGHIVTKSLPSKKLDQQVRERKQHPMRFCFE